MPGYPWLAKAPANAADIQAKMKALRVVGVPYTDAEIAKAPRGTRRQDRAGRAGRVPAEHGPRDEEREVADGICSHSSAVRRPCWRSSPSSASSSGPTAAAAGRPSTRRRTHRSRFPTTSTTAPSAAKDERQSCGATLMSDFTSDFWNWYIIGITARCRSRSAPGCCCRWPRSRRPPAARRRPHPRPAARKSRSPATSGTATSPSSTTRCRGGGCGCSGSPSCSRWATWSSTPGSARFQGVLGWTSTGAYAKESAEMDAKVKPLYDKYLAMDLQQVAADPAGAGDGRAHLPQQLRAVPRLRRRRRPRASRTCATSDWLYGGAPETIVESVTNGRMGVMPALGAALGGEDNVKNVVAYVRSLSGLSHDGTKAQLGKAQFEHDLRGLPRRRRQGQPGPGRAEPHRQDLAVRQLRGDDRRGHQQGPQRQRRRQARRRCPRSRLSSARRRSSSRRPTSGACRGGSRPPRRKRPRRPGRRRRAVIRPRLARPGAPSARRSRCPRAFRKPIAVNAPEKTSP